MKLTFMLPAVLFMGIVHGQPATAQSPVDLVKQGVEALGGADALGALKTSVYKADVKHWEPGQSKSVKGESRFLGDSTVAISVDYASPIRVRYDWDRDMQYPAVERLKYSEIRYSTYGAAIDEKGTFTPMSSIRLAANIREGARVSPVLLLRAMSSPQNISPIEDQ